MEEAAGFLELLGPGAQAHLPWSPAGVCAPLLPRPPAGSAWRELCEVWGHTVAESQGGSVTGSVTRLVSTGWISKPRLIRD